MKLNQVKRQPIYVTLSDGVEREIKFTLNAMALLEEKYGTVEEAFAVLEKGSISAVRYILWATIQGEEELTERQLGNLIDMQSLGTIMEAFTKANQTDLVQPSDVETFKVVGTVEGAADPN